MLTRREVLAGAVTMASGRSLTDPIGRWMRERPSGTNTGSGRVGVEAVATVERLTRQFMAEDAAFGGASVRDAAVGHLKYAVDLTREAHHTATARLLSAVADLAGWVGWMSHDVGLEGPAQRYLLFGLHAARAAGGDAGAFRAVGLLTDLARQSIVVGHPDTALRLLDLASDALPSDGRRLHHIRSLIWNVRAQAFGTMGSSHGAEARSAVALSFELSAKGSEDEATPELAACFPYTNGAELASGAAAALRFLAVDDRTVGQRADWHARAALVQRPVGFTRSAALDGIELARIGFACGEPERAAADGRNAVAAAKRVTGSARVAARMTALLADSEPYRTVPAVREFRELCRL
jgi:hypothetical protein